MPLFCNDEVSSISQSSNDFSTEEEFETTNVLSTDEELETEKNSADGEIKELLDKAVYCPAGSSAIEDADLCLNGNDSSEPSSSLKNETTQFSLSKRLYDGSDISVNDATALTELFCSR